MTEQEIRERIETIRKTAIGQGASGLVDHEIAHELEDRLYVDVLMAIAGGQHDPGKLAAAALEARKIKFRRWYA